MRAVCLVLLLVTTAHADPPIRVCDEVEALLDGEDCSLCSGYRYTPSPSRLTEVQLWDGLTRSRALHRARRCGVRHGRHGVLDVRVTVNPAGQVTRVAIDQPSGSAALDRCIVAAVGRTRLELTDLGGTPTAPIPY